LQKPLHGWGRHSNEEITQMLSFAFSSFFTLHTTIGMITEKEIIITAATKCDG